MTHYTSFFWVYYQLAGLRPLLTSAAGGAEEEGSRSTVVTVPPHDVGSAPTLTSTGVTQGAEGTLRVTLACWEKSRDLINSPHPVSLYNQKPEHRNSLKLRTHGSFMQQSGDTEDVVVTDVGHGAFDDALAALQTSVALERIPRSLAVDPMEHVQLPDPRY